MNKHNIGKGLLIFSFLLAVIIPLSTSALTGAFNSSGTTSSSYISFPHIINTQEERMNVQTVLNRLLSPSPNLVVDGIIGTKSINAIKLFQQWRGITVDGKVGPITRSHLEVAQGGTQTTNTNNTTTTPSTTTTTECGPGALYSYKTGQLCNISTSNLPTGCTSYTTYSPITGVACNQSTTCRVGYQLSNNTCVPISTCSGSTTASCTISNGVGTQTRVCNSGTWSSYGSCLVSSCNTGYVSSGNTCVISQDITKPVITAFTVPSTSTLLTIPVSLTASDNASITGYLLTESGTLPSIYSFSSIKPTSYTFSSSGTKYLYAWVKDSSSLISSSTIRTITVTVPVTTCSGSPTLSCTITNGTGTKTRTCNSGVWSSYGSCIVTSCNTNYMISGNTCISSTDTTKPVISSYSISTTSSSLSVPILSLYATDNKGVTGYTLTESSTIPPLTSTWYSIPPTTYTFSSSGTKYLYAWARDVAGNISYPINRTTIITLPITTCSGSTTTSCSITNGTGTQSRTCNSGVWSSYGSCTLSSCNSGYTQSGNGCIIPQDITKPIITAFTISTTSTSLTISISNLTATDNVGVTGYLLTESSAAPTSGTSGWSMSTPNYTFSSSGIKTLYAWAKDAAGNISYPINRTTIITLPITTCSGSTTTSCSITNGTGTQSRTCNSGVWSSYGSCTLSSCNSGYTQSGNGCVAVVTPPVTTGTYYISPTGSDSANGSSSTPWKTLSYACSHATTGGNIIHVKAGTYTETSQCNLAVGVSIEGEGSTNSIIKSHVGGTSPTIYLFSSTEGTNGNQHISNIKMDGDNLIAYSAIQVQRRSNVLIHDSTFINFHNNGVIFNGGPGDGTPITTWATGNKFYNNIVTNCADFIYSNPGTDGRWALGMNGQNGMLIYNNIMTQTQRATGHNGYLIKSVEGYNKGVKIYNNTLTRAPAIASGSFDFAIEFWNSRGGIEVYNNTLQGSIDIAGQSTSKGTYPYSVWVHDNIIGQPALSAYEGTRGVLMEQTVSDVIIERNYINNVASGIYFALTGHSHTVKNIYIQYNIFNNIGSLTASKGWGVYWPTPDYFDHTINNINVWNNVFIGNHSSASNMYGIGLPSMGKATTDISVRNNIVQGFNYGPTFGWGTSGQTIDTLSIENNIFYANGNNNLPRYTNLTPTNNTTKNNKISNPLFVSSSNFHLQSGSPAVNAGINVNLTSDYDGNPIIGLPDIGAYESGYTTGTTTTLATCSGSTTTSCSITNGTGTQSRTCNSGVWSSYGSCTLSSCNTGYTPSGNSCVANTITPTVVENFDLTINGTTTNNSITGTWTGVNIPRNTATYFAFRNNSITSVNSGGYMLQAGDESPRSTNNKLDGEVITGNKFTWNGTDTSSITHGLFTGYNINSVVKYNYLNKVPYGIIFKSGTDSGQNMTFTSGGAAYNIAKNGKFGVRMKGINGVPVYNNTFYNDMYNGSWYLILITENMDRVTGSPSLGAKIKNNIFYTKYSMPTIAIESGSLNNFSSDYNVYYCESCPNHEPIFTIDGNRVSWSGWRSRGYDTHSVIVNPNFIDTINFVPSSPLYYGTNLGTTWQTGLSTSAVWNVGSAPSKSNQSGTSWQVGARVAGTVLGVTTFNFTLNLKYGSTGNEVKELQKILILDGYLKKGSSDGVYGTHTVTAVKEYQRDLGLTPDGTVGLKTREMLDR